MAKNIRRRVVEWLSSKKPTCCAYSNGRDAMDQVTIYEFQCGKCGKIYHMVSWEMDDLKKK